MDSWLYRSLPKNTNRDYLRINNPRTNRIYRQGNIGQALPTLCRNSGSCLDIVNCNTLYWPKLLKSPQSDYQILGHRYYFQSSEKGTWYARILTDTTKHCDNKKSQDWDRRPDTLKYRSNIGGIKVILWNCRSQECHNTFKKMDWISSEARS